MVALRGRRQSGKSRLVTEFVEGAAVPYLFTTAVKNASPAVQLQTVMADLSSSRIPLPQRDVAFAAPATSWADLFARLPLAIGDHEAVVVLDEFPWAAETADTLEGVLQNAWDRALERLPVLVVLVGSDIAMMERLTEHDRPLYGRALERTVQPLSPAGVAEACGPDRDPVDLLDVYLATGGYPRLVTEAVRHRSAKRFVHSQLKNDSSPLAVIGQRVLSSEFRDSESARLVLEAIGAAEVGHATFSTAVARLGGDDRTAGTQVTRALEPLQAKRMISIDVPVGEGAHSRRRRYRITDPYLRFWFRFCAPELAHIERGRADLALSRYDRDYPSWRGRAIEPVVHGAVHRLAADPSSGFAGAETVGWWWDRTNEHEYDLVTTDRRHRAVWLGSVKWRTTRPMNRSDMTAVAEARAVIPNARDAQLLAVCPAGATPDAGFDRVLTARDMLDSYR
jgi:AAA+ ATPase superfamily predicted ATPase